MIIPFKRLITALALILPAAVLVTSPAMAASHSRSHHSSVHKANAHKTTHAKKTPASTAS